MSQTSFLTQPFCGQLGDTIIELCESKRYDELLMAVAFAKVSGVLRLKTAFEAFRSSGSQIKAYIGIDLGGTSYEALIALFEICDELHITHVYSSQTFHPKIYAFKSPRSMLAIVGSHNLTGGGLWSNIESCSITTLNANDASDFSAIKMLNSYFDHLGDLDNHLSLRVESKEFIDELLEARLIEKEMVTKVKRAKEAKSEGTKTPQQRNYAFVSGISAPLPSMEKECNSHSKKSVSDPDVIEAIVPLNPDSNDKITIIDEFPKAGYQTLWFETRRLTGGSRNILDLSMKARIEKGNPLGTEYDIGESDYMGGGVLFFGIDPRTSSSIDVTINYEGIDYFGNTVKFPEGDKANGTWRLQIKGVSATGSKITDAFERDYLVEKILVFERIEQDYFTMTVFPESDLLSFSEASEIVARNGASRQSKLFGLL